MGFYLRSKLDMRRVELDRVIPVVDIYSLDPWELPRKSGELCIGDEQWFFFSPRQEREANGGRPNRITPSGYWKATGIPGYVFSSDNRTIGLKRTMVFYQGKAPTGTKTKWKVNEYKAIEEATTSAASLKVRHEVNLCRVYVTSGNLRSFDRRPLVAAPREMFDRADHRREAMPNVDSCNNIEDASCRNFGESAHGNNPSMEEHTGYLYSSLKEETSNDLNMINDMDALWNSIVGADY